MRFALTEEQEMLQKATRDLAASVFDTTRIVAATAAGRPVDATEAWAAIRDGGLAGLLVAPEHGGSGGTVTDACVVAEALGEALAPVPFVGSAIAAAGALRECGGPPAAMEALARGEPFSLVVAKDLSWPTARQELAWDWMEGAQLVALRGGNAEVLHGASAQVTTPAVDPLHHLAVVAVESPPAPAGTPTPGQTRAAAIARVGAAAFALGLSTRALTSAVAYAKERVQYGRPIGSFQALQHLCAEMLVDVETARSMVYGASWTVERGDPVQAGKAGAAALAWAGDASVRVCEGSIQVLGGIGVTQEHPAHLLLRSAHFFGNAFGGVSQARRALALSWTHDGRKDR